MMKCRLTGKTLHASRKIAAALLSGILLFCSFPPLEYSVFAWIALIPLIYLCFSCKPGESFLYGLLAGAVFWLASIFWLTKVSFIGWFFIGLYCAFYFALFALVVSWWHDLTCRNSETLNIQRSTSNFERRDSGSMLKVSSVWRSDLILIIGIPALWVGLEYARSIFLTGFPWNLLGVSQYSYVNLIQCADWGGVYLISYLIIMFNTAAVFVGAALVARPDLERTSQAKPLRVVFINKTLIMRNIRQNFRTAGMVAGVCFLIICLALLYGKWRLVQSPEKLETIRVASIQPNVPQQLKWSEEWADDICRRLKKATEEACRAAPLDLIVWPETALPDFVQASAPSRKLVNDSRRHGVPLLVGSMDLEELPEKTNYFNSSFLFLPGQNKPQVYAKRHLVLFGEYVPLANYFPFLRSISGVEEDFMPGKENVVFRLNGKDNKVKKFSVLICFEDILPYLARECVKAGARLLINQTNDAWFDPSWASRQHMTHCVFRCIENRVACLRSTNTGLTCLIDRFGVIRSALPPLGNEPREPCSEATRATPACPPVPETDSGRPGSSAREASPRRERILQGEPQFMRSEVKFSPENMPLTFYTRHGDLFALACAAFSLPLLIGTLLNFLRKQ